MKIERMLSKDEILELYLNKSFFGNRAYGVAAAAEYYYGKPLDQLTLDETATLVSALKFPSSGNPISNPERNHQRSVYVIQRMLEDKYITPAQAVAAQAEPMHAKPHERPVEVYAPYVAEMVRQEMIARFGGEVLTKGYHVTTTIDPAMQVAADVAVRDGLRLYDHRHGWNGIERHFEITADADAAVLASAPGRNPGPERDDSDGGGQGQRRRRHNRGAGRCQRSDPARLGQSLDRRKAPLRCSSAAIWPGSSRTPPKADATKSDPAAPAAACDRHLPASTSSPAARPRWSRWTPAPVR